MPNNTPRQAKAVGSTKGQPATTETEFDPAQPLDNPQHEAFAQSVAQGLDATAAYKQTYQKASHDSANSAGPRLLGIVRQRVKAIQAKAEDATLLTIIEKRRFCALVLRTPIGEIDESSPLCQSAKYQVNGGINGRLRRGVADEGNEVATPETTTVELRMVDKLKALQLDNELAGHVKQVESQAVNVSVGVNVSVMSEDRRKELMDRRKAVLTGNN